MYLTSSAEFPLFSLQNINQGDANGRTALHWASYFGALPMVERLLTLDSLNPTLLTQVGIDLSFYHLF
jgi:ankyrin repeat protein